jgi:hypothetical protein
MISLVDKTKKETTPMEIIVPMQVKVCHPEDEVVPIENLVYLLKNLRIGARLIEKKYAGMVNQNEVEKAGMYYRKL